MAADTSSRPTLDSDYSSFFSHAAIGLYRTAPDGCILDANESLASMLGFPSREALLEANAADMYLDPEDRRRQVQLMSGAGVIRGYQMRLRRLDGSIIWVEDNCYAIRDAAGRVLCHEGSLHDITSRKLAQERLTGLSRSFLDFGSDPLANINRLTALCGELLRADCALYNRMEGGMLYAWAQWRTPLDYNPLQEAQGHVCAGIIAGNAAEPVVVRDLASDPLGAGDRGLKAMGLRSYVGQAVQAGDGAVGCLCVFFKHQTEPTAEELSLMKTVAVAIGIEEKRKAAETTTMRQARQMAALYETSLEIGAQHELADLLTAIVRRAASMVGAPMGALLLLDQSGEALELVVSYNMPSAWVVGGKVPLGAGVAGRVAQSGELLMVGDFATWPGRLQEHEGTPLRRMLGVPLKVGDRVLGVLNISDDQQAGPFTEDEQRLVTLFADQAAIALENTRLYAAAQHELDERRKAEQALRDSEDRYRRLFEDSPVSLWEEDFSALKRRLDELKAAGVPDLAAYFASRPAEVLACGELINVIDVNRSTVELYGAASKEQLIGSLGRLVTGDSVALLLEEIGALGSGKLRYEGESSNRTLTGARLDVSLSVTIAPGHEQDWSRVIVSVVDITQQKRSEDRLRYLGTHDVLTGIHNRAYFEEEIARLEGGAERPISVLMVDVDDLKVVNDRFGHAAGDLLLRRAAQALRQAFRSGDVVARIGGDEFAVLLPGADARIADEAVIRVRAVVEAQQRGPAEPPLSMSMGAATADTGAGLTEAIRSADALMYQHKEARREARAGH